LAVAKIPQWTFGLGFGQTGRLVAKAGSPPDKILPYYDSKYGIPNEGKVHREAKELTIYDKPTPRTTTTKRIKTRTHYFDTFLLSEGKVYYHLQWQLVATNIGEKDGKTVWKVEYAGIKGEPANKLPPWAQGDTLHGGNLPNGKYGGPGTEIVYTNPIPKENR
jgi:hypothetical protein